MKKSTLIKWHLYCGLFTSFYLLSFGVSSLILNHKIDIENTEIKDSWTRQVKIDPQLSDDQLAKDVRDQLGLMGWPIPWKYERDVTSFKFNLSHLGKNYDLNLDLGSGLVNVDEIPKGFVAVLQGLHFFNGKIPNAPFFLRTWMVYQWVALLVLLISLILGLWLWLKFSHKTWELYLFGGLFIFSVFLMIIL